jgi:cytosine/adenosine deaminase-related metal-dependent hydrolase
MPTIALKARWVFPVSAPPIVDGVVTIAAGQIVAVGREAMGCVARDLGNAAIVPGLINAHTHLEFNDVSRPLGRAKMAFPDWIRQVVEFRRGRVERSESPIRQGLQESLAAGTTSLGEIARPGWPVNAVTHSPLAPTVFLEAIGLSHEFHQRKMAEARAHLEQSASAGRWRAGLCPHAPYTVHPELFASLIELAAERRAPLAFHLAESPEELELLSGGGGPFCELLVELGAWDSTAIPKGARPLDYLRHLAEGERVLVIHGNYLDLEEVEFVASHSNRLSLVYCPRTHAYFGHTRYPLLRLLAAGANVALGTDSRASNPDLSILEEIRFVARHFPEVPPATVLELGTLRGARALGLDDVGCIEPGKTANLAIVALPEREAGDPHELLFDSELAAGETICARTSAMVGGT